VDRIVRYVLRGNWTRDGAGVRLYRVFGGVELAELLDPFLLLDHFGSRYPHEYLMGFPWHPHRGIETVTYLLKGEVHHEDSTGNKGVIRSGDLQWMTAGSGIFHEEMPKPGRVRIGDAEVEDPEVNGFQLWVNLPRSQKMVNPKYRNLIRENVPIATLETGGKAAVIAGRIRVPNYGVIEGPITDLTVPVQYMDVQLPEESSFNYHVKDGYTAIAYVIEGAARFDKVGRTASSRELVVYSRDGEDITVETGDKPVRFLLLAGRPLGEPIAWYGPIVMNTWDEVMEAFEELRKGTFIKARAEVQDYQ